MYLRSYFWASGEHFPTSSVMMEVSKFLWQSFAIALIFTNVVKDAGKFSQMNFMKTYEAITAIYDKCVT